jgi:hypothetical protein
MKDAIEVSIIFHEGQRMFAVPKQPAPVQGDSDRINWLTNNPLDALDIFGHVKGADAVRWIRQEIDNAIAAKLKETSK